MKRGTKIFLVVLLVLFVAAVIAAAVAIFSFMKPGVPDRAYLEVKLRGSVNEYDPNPDLSGLFGPAPSTLSDTVFALKEAKEDPKILGAILRVEQAGMGFGKIQELRAAIQDFRSAGKPVFAYMEWAGNGSYYLATACDKIYLLPTSEVGLTGLYGEPLFVRGTLDKLKIQPESIQREEYKSAAEMFTNEKMSDYAREEIESLLDSYMNDMITGIAEGRKLSPEAVKEIVDQGPYTSREAREKQLVDELLYQDQFEEKLEKGRGDQVQKVTARRYLEDRGLPAGFQKIGIVFAQGPILSGEGGGSNPFGGMQILSGDLSKAIREAREDDSVKAVVMRVDSPGGSAIASDVIWREVALTRKEKPFIISMSDVAGSGGYWISMGADQIVAQPGTITGSIGVILLKFNMRDFYSWIGVTKDPVQRGQNAGIWSDYHAMTETEKAAMERMIQFIYDEFLRKVAEGRGMKVEDVRKIAKGRIWTGTEGKRNGLVDAVGGYPEAIAIAREKAGIAPDARIGYVFYPRRKTLLEAFLQTEQTGIARAMPPSIREAAWSASVLDELSQDGPVALCPEGLVRFR